MRLKLVLLTSLIAALIGALLLVPVVVTVGTIDYAPDSPEYRSGPWFRFIVYLPPLLSAVLGAVFVYRHTALRRKLQAILTAAIVLLLFAAALAVLMSRYS